MSASINRRTFIGRVIGTAMGATILPISGMGNALKKVILIGDSIRLGYQPYTSLYLMEKADIRGPESSCGHTYHILENAYRWLGEEGDVIYHISACHHDIMTVPYESNKNLVDISDYVANIQRIIKYIHLANPKAIIIWATSTPVVDEKVYATLNTMKGNGLYNKDVIIYNNAAVKEVTRLGIPVNDLYTYVLEGDPDRIMLEDGIHFNETGYQLLGEQVANALQVFL